MSAPTRAMGRAIEGSIAFLRQRVIPRVPEMVRALERSARDMNADLILGHHISLGAPWVAERLGVAWAMCAVAPASWTSLEQVTVYPGMPDKDRYSPGVMRAAVRVGSAVTDALIDPALNKVRRSLGIPPARSTLFKEMFSGVANLGLWSPVFRPPASDDAPRSVVCGFVESPPVFGTSEQAERVVGFLNESGGAVVFTLGTSVPHASERFFAAATHWAQGSGHPTVLLTGSPGVRLPALPSNAVSAPFAPLGQVLQHASCIVHHGGLGTIGCAVRAGVPMVCVPHLHDQFDNAARCRRLGVSVTVSRRRLGSIGEAIDRVRSDPTYSAAAQRVRGSIAGENGASAAAIALERAMGLASGASRPAQDAGDD